MAIACPAIPRSVLFVALVAGLPSHALAGGAPAALYGKSIKIHWSESRQGKFTDGAAFHRLVHVDFAFYVSGGGRIFSRMGRTIVNNRGQVTGSGGTSKAPDGTKINASKNNYASQLQFAGQTAQSVVQYESGARRITITFDQGFGSCSLAMTHGKEDGAPGLVLRSAGSGRLYMLTSVDISGASCAVQPGNVFESES